MSMTSKKMILGLFAATALLSACGEKAKEVAKEIDKQANELQANDQWKSNCTNVHLDVFGLSSQVEQYDIGASLTKDTTLFNEDNCATPLVQVTEHGRYEIGAKVAGEAYNLDISYETVAITPLNETGKDALNAIKACGISDWAIGQKRDVTSASSDNPVLARCWTKTPRSNFDLIEITGDKLKFGLTAEGKDKSSPEKRPVNIDQETTYTRQ